MRWTILWKHKILDFQHIPKISFLDQGYVYSLTKKASFKTKLYNLILKKNDVDIGEESVKQISFKAFIYHTYLFILNSSYKLTYWNWLISRVRMYLFIISLHVFHVLTLLNTRIVVTRRYTINISAWRLVSVWKLSVKRKMLVKV